MEKKMFMNQETVRNWEDLTLTYQLNPRPTIYLFEKRLEQCEFKLAPQV